MEFKNKLFSFRNVLSKLFISSLPLYDFRAMSCATGVLLFPPLAEQVQVSRISDFFSF